MWSDGGALYWKQRVIMMPTFFVTDGIAYGATSDDKIDIRRKNFMCGIGGNMRVIVTSSIAVVTKQICRITTSHVVITDDKVGIMITLDLRHWYRIDTKPFAETTQWCCILRTHNKMFTRAKQQQDITHALITFVAMYRVCIVSMKNILLNF